MNGAKAGHMHQFGIACRTRRFRHTLQVGIEVEVLLHGEVFVKAEALRHVADAALHLQRLGCGIHAEYGDASRVRHQQAGSKPHQGGLAGGIGTDQSGDHAMADAKADLLQGIDLALADVEGL